MHWGGGTPSIPGVDWLNCITDQLHSRFNLALLREHAIELDPRHLTRPLAQTLRDIGVHRASLGVQFTPEVQRAMGRIQPFELVENAVAMLCEAGIGKINLDLMYGLPKQTVRDVRKTVTLARALKPQRIAVFGYAHVPWFKPQQTLIDERDCRPARRDWRKPRRRTRYSCNLAICRSVDHYARPDDELAPAATAGRLHRNFQGYTVDDADALLGLGASAISRLPQGFAQNAPDVGGCLATRRRGRQTGHGQRNCLVRR